MATERTSRGLSLKLRPLPVTIVTRQAPAAEKVFGNCWSGYGGWVVPGVLGGGTHLPPDCTLRKYPGASRCQPRGPAAPEPLPGSGKCAVPAQNACRCAPQDGLTPIYYFQGTHGVCPCCPQLLGVSLVISFFLILKNFLTHDLHGSGIEPCALTLRFIKKPKI